MSAVAAGQRLSSIGHETCAQCASVLVWTSGVLVCPRRSCHVANVEAIESDRVAQRGVRA